MAMVAHMDASWVELGFGRIVVAYIEVPDLFANLV